MVTSVTAEAAKFRRLAADMQTVKPRALAAGGKVVQAAEAQAGGRLRNLGKGTALSATVKVTDVGTIYPKPKGAWAIVEHGARPHVITPRGGQGGGKSFGSRKRRALGHRLGATIGGGDRRAVLKIPGIGYRKWAHHPGSRPRPKWSRTADAVHPRTIAAMHRVVIETIGRVF